MTPLAGPSTQTPSYDYTEGASVLDIDNAVVSNQRSRRDSQYSTMYGDDGEGAIFSGPGHSDFVNPSSVSRMSHIEAGRRSSEGWSRTRRMSQGSRASSRREISRRLSTESQVSRQSTDPGDSDEDDGRSELSRESRSRRVRPSSPPRHSVFENIANLFGRASSPMRSRRPSFSQRSSTGSLSRRSQRSRSRSEYAVETDDEGEERWGYSSGEEEDLDEAASIQTMDTYPDNISVSASMAYDSDPPSPSASQGLPLLASDQIFGGESRIEMQVPFALLDPPPLGPPSRQTIYIPDEDSTIRLVGYEVVAWRRIVWRIGCVVTFGILGLLGHWFPSLWLKWAAHEKAFSDSHHGFVVVEVSCECCIELTPTQAVCIQRYIYLPYPDHQLSLFYQHSILGGTRRSVVESIEWGFRTKYGDIALLGLSLFALCAGPSNGFVFDD